MNLKISFTDNYPQKWKNTSSIIRSKVYNIDGCLIVQGVRMLILRGNEKII